MLAKKKHKVNASSLSPLRTSLKSINAAKNFQDRECFPLY